MAATPALVVSGKPSPRCLMDSCSVAPLVDAAFHQDSSPTSAKHAVNAELADVALTDVLHVERPQVADADTVVAVPMENCVVNVLSSPMRPVWGILTEELSRTPTRLLDNHLNPASHLSTLTRTIPLEVQETSCVTIHLRSVGRSLGLMRRKVKLI